MRIRIGTRHSPLAIWQATWVAQALESIRFQTELIPITTTGDVAAGDLSLAGQTGWFTKEIQRALLDGRCDVAVHSLKDLPTQVNPKLRLIATPPREDTRDALISRNDLQIEQLPMGAKVGTGSPRRRAQLLALRPDLVVPGIRGNVETRIAKLDRGEFDAIVLAAAGLKRLGSEHRITQFLEPPQFLPAIGQGALGLEIRADDRSMADAVSQLNDPVTMQATLAERSLLRTLKAGCLAPVGTIARIEGRHCVLVARVLAEDGSSSVQTTVEGVADEPDTTGRIAAELLQLGGADALIERSRPQIV